MGTDIGLTFTVRSRGAMSLEDQGKSLLRDLGIRVPDGATMAAAWQLPEAFRQELGAGPSRT